MKGRIGLVVLLVAIAAAVASGLYLLRAQKKVEQAVQPVVVAAPDLYPPDTLLFAAAHRMDESWNAFEAWWKRFEQTATWHLLEKEWKDALARKSLPGPAQEAVDSFTKAMDEAEARLGRRPNTREFFETYGKYTAFGLLPAKGDGKPRMLVVVKLPGEAAMAALRERLGGVAKVKRNEPAELHGYPVWVEEGGPSGRVLYGVGGGYLFVADEADGLGDALGRLAALAGTERPAKGAAPPASLSGDAVFRRGVPGDWEKVGLALYVRKDQQFSRWSDSLKLLDEYVRHLFVMAPADPAVAFAAIRTGTGAEFEVRSSFSAAGAAKPWEECLPAGCCWAWMSAPPKEAPARAALLAEFEAFRGKQAWKEIDALLRDGPRLRRLLEEALGAEAVPGDEVLRRLPNDAEFLASNFRALVESALLAPTTSFAVAYKTYDAPKTGLEFTVATALDPVGSLLVAGLFDLAVEKGKEMKSGVKNPFEAAGVPGVQAWRFRMGSLLRDVLSDSDDDEADMMAGIYEGSDPGVILAGGRAWFTMGDRMFAEVRDLAAGKGSALASDALFREASAAVPSGAESRAFSRPAETFRGAIAGYRALLDRMTARIDAPPEARDVLTAALAAFDEIVTWQKSVRASMAVTFADPAHPAESAELMDPAEEKAHPRLELDPAAFAAPDLLPAGTCLLAEGRADVRPATEAVVAAFLKAFPGGREKWDRLRAEVELPKEDLEGRLDALFVDMKGEVGFAVATPPVQDVMQLEGNQDLLDRIPAFVFFSGYARPEAAFDAAATLFDRLAELTRDSTPFETRKRLFDRRQGERPVGTESLRTEVGGNSVAVFRVLWPEAPRGALLSVGMAVVRRGDLLFFTTSLPVATAIANAAPGGEGTLGARLRAALPPGTIPSPLSRLVLQNEDAFADCLGLYTRPMAPNLVGLSLAGVRERPAEERIRAHQEGWSKVALLLDDLLRTGRWNVSTTVREKDVVRTVVRRVPAK